MANRSSAEVQPKKSSWEADDESQQDEEGHHEVEGTESTKVGASASKAREHVGDPVEHRKLWSMAAASVAHLLKEFSAKPIPDLVALQQSFEPYTPVEWIHRREAAAAAALVAQEGDDLYSIQSQQDLDDDTDADAQVDLFYDADANDDDLQVFLGDSDQDIPAPRGSEDPQSSQISNVLKKSFLINTKKVPLIDKVIQQARNSLAKRSLGDTESPNLPKKDSSASNDDSAEKRESMDQTGSEEKLATDSNKLGTFDALKRDDKSHVSAMQLPSLTDDASDDDDYWDLDAKPPDETIVDEDDPNTMYHVTDTEYDIVELSKGLESLLEDLQLESRITNRFKYKLMNKFNLLLHALVATHDREYEIMQHLVTKHKILNILNNFVKADAELAIKLIVTEEKSVDDEVDQGMILDLGRKSLVEEVEGTKEHDQGLSIEEMNARTIRDTLLQQKNRIDVLEAMKRIQVLKLKQKEFEKTLLTLHYSKMVKPADLNKEVKEVKRLVHELQLDIATIQQDMSQIQAELKVQEHIVAEEDKVVEKLEIEALNKQGEVGLMQNKPIQIQKDADKEAQKLEQLQDMHNNIIQKQLDSMDSYKSHQGKIDKLTHDLNNLIREEGKLSMQKKNSLREIERLMTQMEALMTREQIMLDKAAQMTDKVQQATKMKQKVHDDQQKLFNEASKALRVAQRLERSIKMASEAFINARLAHEKMRSAFDAARPSEEDSNWQRLSRMLEREIHNLKMGLEKKLEESAIKGSMVDRLKIKLNELYDEQVGSGKELQELIRTTVRKRREREEKSEQCIKLDGQMQRFDQDITMRELIIEDCQRSTKELSKHIEIMKTKIGTVKLEKSALMNDVDVNKEKLAESRETLKILETEIKEIGLFMLDLEKELKDQHYLILNARLARDSERNATLRSRDKFRYHRKEKDELLLGNKTRRRELLRQKQDVSAIRKQFETGLADTNKIALSVRERIEEICTFQEYIHSYDTILLRGANEITVRELERTKLASLADELRKHVLIVKMNQPNETVFFEQIETLRKEYYEKTEQRRKLELELNEDENPARVREINFDVMKDRENVGILEKRLDTIEGLLGFSDAIGLERTLIENHVAKITDDGLSRAVYLKETFGEQVKIKINVRKNLRIISRQIDGLICENAIASSQAETAESMFLRFRKQLAEAEVNFEKGLPPTKEMEVEWNKNQWKKKMMARAYQNNCGFLRQVKHKQGYQVNTEKLRPAISRKLEDPNDSCLNWFFSAESSSMALTFPAAPTIACLTGVTFHNSAVNPRKSCQINRKISVQSVQSQSQPASKKTTQILFKRN